MISTVAITVPPGFSSTWVKQPGSWVEVPDPMSTELKSSLAPSSRKSGTLIVIDCGTGAYPLGQRLVSEFGGKVNGHMLISHTHWDHIQGFPFFPPVYRPDSTLYVYSIVHRSYPGIEVPYVSAVVDLEGGGTVKGNLINVDPEPEKLPFDMPVEVVYQKAPRKDKEGNEYVTYYFQPAS